MRVAYLTDYQAGPNAAKLHKSKSRDILIVAPKRSGKTYSLLWDIIEKSWSNPFPDFLTLVTAPTYKHLWMLLERPLASMLKKYRLLEEHNKTDRLIVLRNGRGIVFRSLDNPDSVEGLNVYRAYTDEFTICSEQACDAVQARCLLTNGAYVRAGTPKGTSSWVYRRYYGPDAEPAPATEFIRYSITDNPLITDESIDRIKSQLDPLLFRQDVLAEWVNLTEDRVYHAFTESANVKSYEPDWSQPIWIGLDYNLGINAWIAFQRIDRAYYVFAEGSGARTTRDLAAQLQANFGDRAVYIWDDASGGIRQQGDAWTQRQVIRQAYPSAKLMQPNVNPERTQRYANVNAHFCNGLGQSHLFIAPNCRRLITEILNLVYKTNSDVPDDQNGRSGHITDALGYALWGCTGGRVQAAPRVAA